MSFYIGPYVDILYQCSTIAGSHTITLVNGAGGLDTYLVDENANFVAEAGNESLTINCNAPAVCGDGNLDPGEQCDDGNTADGDGCSSTCQIEALPTPPGPPGIGGIVDVVSDGDAPAEMSGSSSNNYALPIAAVIAGAIMALAVGGWYARRRLLR